MEDDTDIKWVHKKKVLCVMFCCKMHVFPLLMSLSCTAALCHWQLKSQELSL